VNPRYQQAIEALEAGRDHTMTVTGNSMVPLIYSKSKLTFSPTGDYQVGDVVFCKVDGRLIDAHKITKVGSDGRFMISNNKGYDNGWASKIYGRVVAVNGEPFGRRK
jgi:SOS-response transcriptional repressor LexA